MKNWFSLSSFAAVGVAAVIVAATYEGDVAAPAAAIAPFISDKPVATLVPKAPAIQAVAAPDVQLAAQAVVADTVTERQREAPVTGAPTFETVTAAAQVRAEMPARAVSAAPKDALEAVGEVLHPYFEVMGAVVRIPAETMRQVLLRAGAPYHPLHSNEKTGA